MHIAGTKHARFSLQAQDNIQPSPKGVSKKFEEGKTYDMGVVGDDN